ncbi:MAG: helicase C-terminal domain-containing protein [Candidatus Dormibacteraeota bacterium]|nr:helicase C-terminal domain-containing protein [Candidatus Dormibacteraeota bacterium]
MSELPAEYLEAGHLRHGYAITGHKAQGTTADRAFVLGDEAIYREWGYMALSRGRAENRLYVVAGELEPTDDSGHGRIPTTQSESFTLGLIESALMKSSEQRLALDQFQKVAGRLPTAEPAPPPIPPKDLDDAGLRAAAAAAERALTHREPFPDVAEPNLVDPGRTVIQLSEQRRYLTERRARLEAEMEFNLARLTDTDGVIARRRHREERGWVHGYLSRGARDIADIDRQLPQLETRISGIRGDQVAADGWYRCHADAARRWRDLYDEACARITRRVQAAGAAPSIVGHAVPPASFSAQWEWWSSAVEVERSRLWEGGRSVEGCAIPGPKPHDQAATLRAARPGVADLLIRCDEAEAHAEQRRERQRRRDAQWVTDPFASGHAARGRLPQADQRAQVNRGPSLSP